MPKIREIREGRALQLPIYLKMAKEWLREHETLELEQAGALYYKIRLDKFTTELGIGKGIFERKGIRTLQRNKVAGFWSRKWSVVRGRVFRWDA